jgi:predicted anti-sigma-YlaC factor YlaD
MTWVVVLFNIIMLAWIIIGVSLSHKTAGCVHQLGSKLCTDATQAGTAIGVGILIVLWVTGDIILGMIWLVTNGRSCPVCGRSVKRGRVSCKGCGHDFRGGTNAVA